MLEQCVQWIALYHLREKDMNRISSGAFKHVFIWASLLLLPTFMFSACALGGGSGGGTPTATASSGRSTATPGTTATLTSGVRLGPQSCPDAVKDPSHWDPIIPPEEDSPTPIHVGRVSCGNLIGQNSLQALVNAYHEGTGQILDVYVYTNITNARPSLLFKLQALYKGDAKISGYNTIITQEVDGNASINKGQGNAELTRDLRREFKWSDNAATFVQVAFSGIYPDLTRYQAEADQAQVNQGQDSWKLSATQVALHLAMDLLKWPADAQTTVVSGGGKSDLNAVVNVVSATPASVSIKVSLIRLEGNTNGGIWIVTSVESPNMSITVPQSLERLTSPTTVTGKGNAFEGSIGMVRILDHLYDDIGHAPATGVQGQGNTIFSASVTYTSSFQGGSQEGLVALFGENNAGGAVPAVIVKVLLSA